MIDFSRINLMSRVITELPEAAVVQAISRLVCVEGTIIAFRSNHKTKSTREHRHWYMVLKPIYLGGLLCDHLCVPVTKSIRRFQVGDSVRFTARGCLYDGNKIGVRPPYKVLSFVEDRGMETKSAW